MITRKMTPFFSSTRRALHLHAKDSTFEPVNMNIPFLLKFANFWYITCSVLNLIPIWPRSHGLVCGPSYFRGVFKQEKVYIQG